MRLGKEATKEYGRRYPLGRGGNFALFIVKSILIEEIPSLLVFISRVILESFLMTEQRKEREKIRFQPSNGSTVNNHDII